MIKSFAKLLYLYDAIQASVPQVSQNTFNVVSGRLAVDVAGDYPSLLIQGAHLACMINGACRRDDLVLETSTFSKPQTALYARFHDVTVALRG